MITPATYTTTQICARFGRSKRWWHLHQEDLKQKHGFPSPVTYDEHLYSREAVEEWFRAGGTPGRTPRRVKCKVDDILDQRLNALTTQAEA